jgi:molybdopterin-guanine dinucleotide biosynthesis protein MobB
MRIFGICGKSTEGRRELVSELVARLRMSGNRVAIVKRAPASFDVDEPHTDSYRQRQSGCAEILIASERRMVLMEEYPGEAAPRLDQLVGRLKHADIVIAVNFRDAPVPRIEIAVSASDEREERNGEWIIGRIAGDIAHFEGRSFAASNYESIVDLILARAQRVRDAPNEHRTPAREAMAET